jgi:hypothetical protein
MIRNTNIKTAMLFMPSLDPTTLDRLLTMMYNINPYVEVFKMARDMRATKGVPMDLKLRLIAF